MFFQQCSCLKLTLNHFVLICILTCKFSSFTRVPISVHGTQARRTKYNACVQSLGCINKDNNKNKHGIASILTQSQAHAPRWPHPCMRKETQSFDVTRESFHRKPLFPDLGRRLMHTTERVLIRVEGS